jgi:AcrR family transcriptional regulator
MSRRQILSRDRVAEAGLRLLEEGGAPELSLARIAEALGVRAPSLYYHYHDKADLLRVIAERVLAGLERPNRGGDWQDWMIGQALSLFRWVQGHPNTAWLLIEHMPDAATSAGFGRGARMLTRAGIDPAAQLWLMEGAQKLTWGFAIQHELSAGGVGRAFECDRVAWPELAEACDRLPWPAEKLLEMSLRAFFAGVIAQTTV